MRAEYRWAAVALCALAVSAALAPGYARLIAPYYESVARLIAAGHPWEVISAEVRAGSVGSNAQIELSAFVREHAGDPNPAAKVVGRVQVGEAIETPLVFLTVLILWPAATRRQRWRRIGVGIPVLLVLEAATTATQFILPMAQASAMLAGDNDPVTGWDHWSRFLESGGQFVLAAGAAAVLAALTRGVSDTG
jgi:hypothetical protein